MLFNPSLAWGATRMLGHVDQSPARLTALARELPDASSDELAKELHAHVAQAQVDEIALDNLRRMEPPAGPLRRLAALLEADVRAHDPEWTHVQPTLRATVQRAAAAGGRLMKGFDVRRHYPRPELRHRGDLDVHFPTTTAAARFIRSLRADGWSWWAEALPWLQWEGQGMPLGQCALECRLDPFTTGADVHIGAYAVGRGATLPLVGFEQTTYDGVVVDGLVPETSIALTAAHAVAHGHLRMKDVNDVAMIARARAVDWASAVALCRAAGVDGALRQLLHWAAAEYGPAGVPDAAPDADGALPVGPGGERRAEPWRPRVVFAHAAPPSRRDRWWLVPPAALGVAGRGPGAGAPWRVDRLADEIELVTRGGACALRFVDDVFVPTASGAVPRDSLALARELAGA